MNIPHPDGGGRQQPDPAAYTIISAQIANAAGDAVRLTTEEAATVLISAADTPALFDKFLAWAQQPGNSAEPYVAPSPVPRTVTKVQAKLALLGANKLTQVEDWIKEQASAAARIRWQDATEFDRDSEFIAEARDALGMTDEEIDALFIAAASL